MHIVKGKRSVLEALQASIGIDHILMSKTISTQRESRKLMDLAERQGIRLRMVPPAELDQIDTGGQHQGVIAYVRDDMLQFDLEEIVKDPSRYPFLVILDHIEDPFNFGGIIRSCEVLGASGIIFPKDRNSQLSPGVIKAASGSVYHLPLFRVVNIANAIQKLDRAGYWIYGTDLDDGESLDTFSPQFPLAVIVGNESRGQSPRLKKLTHGNIHIPMTGQVNSLNVSVAAGILIYTLGKQLRG